MRFDFLLFVGTTVVGLAVGTKVGDRVAGSLVEDKMDGDKVPLKDVGFSLGRLVGANVTNVVESGSFCVTGDDVGSFGSVRVAFTTLLSVGPSTLEEYGGGLCLADKSPAQNPAPNTPIMQSAKKMNTLTRNTVENHSV